MRMAHKRVVVLGAAGYSGVELLKLLAVHPQIELVAAASDRNAGTSVAAFTGAPTASGLAFVTTEAALAISADIAFLAVPHDAAAALAQQLVSRGIVVVDLSNAHRTQPGIPYGFTSKLARDVEGAKLVANPGCYATCVITAAAPLVSAGWIDDDIVVVAGSGVTGAGRSSDEAMSLGELHDNVRAYKVLRHQHVPEIEMALARIGEREIGPRVVLTTHLLPIARGIFATLTMRLRQGAKSMTSVDLVARFRSDYADDPTVVIHDKPEDVHLRRVVGTNQTHVGVAGSNDIVVVTAALDNLIKGAAGQAIENMNLVLGLPRMTGLEHLARHG
jgi:N-acetyl-gamma-glutamyl-phosphate reductase